MMTSHAVHATDLTVRYGDHVAVDQLTFAAGKGEIVGLLGPNGAGKTSVIRALTTIVPVAGGTATIGGHRLSDKRAVRAAIGVLPESNGYPNSQTAPSYLRFYGQLFGLSRSEAEQRAGRLLRRMGLGDNRNQIGTYSRGMRQRLGLARALINDPTVLFLDEPTLGLDPAGKDDILDQLTAAAVEDGTSVILCSHLLDEVERTCDRVAILDRGRTVAEGTVEEVIAVSGVGGRGRVRVRPERLFDAQAALTGCSAVGTTGFDNTRPGDIAIDLRPPADERPGTTILRALLDADIEPQSFDLEGARLSDAFIALTAKAVTT